MNRTYALNISQGFFFNLKWVRCWGYVRVNWVSNRTALHEYIFMLIPNMPTLGNPHQNNPSGEVRKINHGSTRAFNWGWPYIFKGSIRAIFKVFFKKNYNIEQLKNNP